MTDSSGGDRAILAGEAEQQATETAWQSELTDHVSLAHRKQEDGEQEVEPGYTSFKATPVTVSSNVALPTNVPRTSPNRIAHWGPSFKHMNPQGLSTFQPRHSGGFGIWVHLGLEPPYSLLTLQFLDTDLDSFLSSRNDFF